MSGRRLHAAEPTRAAARCRRGGSDAGHARTEVVEFSAVCRCGLLIDRSFIRGLGHEAESESVVACVIELARLLNAAAALMAEKRAGIAA